MGNLRKRQNSKGRTQTIKIMPAFVRRLPCCFLFFSWLRDDGRIPVPGHNTGVGISIVLRTNSAATRRHYCDNAAPLAIERGSLAGHKKEWKYLRKRSVVTEETTLRMYCNKKVYEFANNNKMYEGRRVSC